MTDLATLLQETNALFDVELPNKPYKFRKLDSAAVEASIEVQKPKIEKQFKLSKVIIGHEGWVRGLCADPYGTFIASCSVDKLIKIWSLEGQLKLTLTGHLASIRTLKMSRVHPYLYSAGEDKTIRCWDLTVNKSIRKYHGHLHGVYCMDLDISGNWMVSGGRDACARLWDCRTRKQELVFTGHEQTVSSILINDNHIITGGMDSSIRVYDKRTGTMLKGLTLHYKGVRSLIKHPTLNCFFSASMDAIKVWKLDDYSHFCDLSNFETGIVNAMTTFDDTLVACNNSGRLQVFNTKTMEKTYFVDTLPQIGSIDSEAAILDCHYINNSLYTAEADKTIKKWDIQ